MPQGSRPALVLLCVKSGATAQAAVELGAVLPAGTPVLSLQNGISNAATARDAAGSLHVLPGMVPYNVAELGPGAYHRGTTGRLALLNLNNPVNALSGLPLRAQLLDRGYRRCFAALIDEALAALSAAGIAPAQMAAVRARRLPTVMRLPDWLFTRVAAPRNAKMIELLDGGWPTPPQRLSSQALCRVLGL